MSPISTSQTVLWPGQPIVQGERPALTKPRSLRLWMAVATSRGRLTRELAEGADSGSSPQLALRAEQLTGNRHRKQLTSTLRRVISEAHDRRPAPARVVIINRAAVLDAEDAIDALIARLSYAEPLRAEGMAIAERMLSNADGSPLYNPAEPGSLRRLVRVATEALDPTPRAQAAVPIAA